MPKAHATWTVLPHGPLVRLADNLWTVEGDLPDMSLKRRMTVARMSDGGLLLHNPVALSDAAMAEVEALGQPAVILVPNGWHRLDCASFKRRYPEARLLCPRGSRARVEEVVAVDGSFDELPDDPSVRLQHLAGVKEVEGVLQVQSSDGLTLVFNDVLFNQPHMPGFGGLVMRVIGSSGPPKVTRIARWFMVKDKRAFAEHLARLAAAPGLVRAVPGHGQVLDADAAAVLAGIAGDL